MAGPSPPIHPNAYWTCPPTRAFGVNNELQGPEDGRDRE
jgi:hypothetical protein